MTASLSQHLSFLLFEHCTRYPLLQVQDVYKLLYQACMGSGHAIRDLAQARFSLEGEIQNLDPDRDQPLVEQISPEARLDRKVVRVNLRRYMAATSDSTPLLDAFIRTSCIFEASILRLGQYYASLLSAESVPGGLSFNQQDLMQYIGKMREQNFPAIHHSQVYTQNYKPAYRVVAGSLLLPILEVCRMN